MKRYALFFSHSPQITWFSLMARILRQRFDLQSILWVIGESSYQEGCKTGEFVKVIDLVCDKLAPPMLSDVGSAIKILSDFEDECGATFINQDIAMDRYIDSSHWQRDHILLYAGSILLRMRSEIKHSGVPIFVVGEENSLPYRVARRLIKAPYFCPHVIGHLGDRFYFEYTMYEQWSRCQEQYQRFRADGIPDELHEQAEKRLDELTTHRMPPAEIIRFHSQGGNSLSRKLTLTAAMKLLQRNWSSLVSATNPWDPRSLSVFQDNVLGAVWRFIFEARHKWYFKSVAMKELPVDKEFAVFFLHMQPEHTVEGLSFEYQDQAATAKIIASALPADTMLLVKEHPTMVGKRPIEFYRELESCPNVLLFDDVVNSYEVVQRARIMFTLVGSVALECMYVGTPAIVLGTIYHTAFEGIYAVDNIRQLPELVREILSNKGSGALRPDAIAALAAMYATSHNGKFGGQYSLVEMEQPENLDFIASALEKELSLQQT